MTESIVINASPLIIMSKTGYLWILADLFPKIYLSDVVKAEILRKPFVDSNTLSDAVSKFSLYTIDNDPRVVSWDIGKGETSVISFSLHHPDVRPVLDDMEAKSCCLSFGIKPLGTGSILIIAKRKGLLSSVKSVLFEMRSQGMWIADKVINSIAKVADE